MKRVQLILVLSTLFLNSIGQSQIDGSLKDVGIISPEAANIGKFGNIPVSYSTGIPNISVPIYELKIGKISLPVSLDYHAGGIRVDEISSSVGIGWALNCGGMVSRVKQGLPDEGPECYLSSPVLTTQDLVAPLSPHRDFLINVAEGNADIRPDIFSYNIPGQSGKFIFNQDGSIFQTPLTNNRIEFIQNEETGQTFLSKFRITDENGIQYIFQDLDVVEEAYIQNRPQYITSWRLSKIIDLNTLEEISFTYEHGYALNTQRSYFWEDSWTPRCLDESPSQGDAHSMGLHEADAISDAQQEEFLKEISWREGKIIFENQSDRLDRTGEKRLEKIKVYSNSKLIKEIGLNNNHYFFYDFQTGYINAPIVPENNYRLKLNSVIFLSPDQTELPNEYIIDYNEIPMASSRSCAQDHWGFNNGAFTNTDLIERQSFDNGSGQYNIGDADREINEDYIQACTIKSIHYPTGGRTDFEFETHKYRYIDATVPINEIRTAGGLRIKSISNYGNNNIFINKEIYKYGTDEDGCGILLFPHEILNRKTLTGTRFKSCIVGVIDGGFGCVIENAARETKIVYGDPVIAPTLISGSPVLYEHVTKYQVSESEISKNGKTIYTYSVYQDDPLYIASSFHGNGPILISNIWKNSYLKYEDVYMSTGNTSSPYSLINSKFYDYHVDRPLSKIAFTSSRLPSNGECDNPEYGAYGIVLESYPVLTGAMLLHEMTNTNYDQNGKFITITEKYYYENQTYLNLTKKEITSSSGEVFAEYYKYPFDFAVTGNVYQKMMNNNIISPIIEFTKKKGTVQLLQKTVNYTDEASYNIENVELFQPVSITEKVRTYAVDTRINFNKYDAFGNIIEQQKTNNVFQSYIWDYENAYPVAMVTSPNQVEIAYTSFEQPCCSPSQGNWTLISGGMSHIYAFTGRSSYTMCGNNSISKSGLNAAVTYIISYWSKDGAYLVNGVQAVVNGKTVDGWTYYEQKISGIDTVYISGCGYIDELRLYPDHSQMVTYTYDPLIGITSQCDINNRVTYYEYDGFNRLNLVRDQDKNIVRKLCYNYAGQESNCDGNTNIQLLGNSTNTTFNIRFTHTVTGSIYNIPVTPNSTLSDIGQVPAGIYNIEIIPSGAGYHPDSYYYIFINSLFYFSYLNPSLILTNMPVSGILKMNFSE